MDGIRRAVIRAALSRQDLDDALQRAGWHLGNVLPAAEGRPAQILFASWDGARLLYLVEDAHLGLSYLALAGADRDASVAALGTELGGFDSATAADVADLLAAPAVDLGALARAVAVLALTGEPTAAAVEVFERGLGHPQEQVRAILLNAIAYAPWPALRGALTAVGRSDPSPALRAAAGQLCTLLGAAPAAAAAETQDGDLSSTQSSGGSMPLPYRPRLGDQAMLRRHLVDGQEKLLLHDTGRQEVLELSAEQLGQLSSCDGTRDLGGVFLAAARQGAYHRAFEIEGMLVELAARGLLADGIAPPHPLLDRPDDAGPHHPERPLEVLAGYRLTCDGHGSCCTTYSSVPFSREDAGRALRQVPELASELGGEPTRERWFLPLSGAGDSRMCAVTMVDGRCALLAADGRCRVHQAAGAEAKPRGCRVFPASFVDDGDAVRVSLAVECACVLQSLGRAEGEGDELVPAGARTAADLWPGTRIAELPATVRLGATESATRAELRRWTALVAARAATVEDGVAALWSLAGAVAAHGLDGEATVAALEGAAPPSGAALALRLLSLAGTASDKRESTAAWRSPQDRARRLAEWLDGAAQALLEPAVADERLTGPGPYGAHEAFYLRALIFGYQLVHRELDLVRALRDRATRLLLARQCGLGPIPPSCRDDPSVAYPLTAVEAMMRGQGMDAYAVGLP